jgi:pimeloyl-ACP methyl ester carboxylesterase
VERAAVVGQFHSGPPCIRAAVDHRDRISHLVLDGTYARWKRAPDYPFGMRDETAEKIIEVVAANWGNGRTIEFFASSLAGDERQQEAFAQYERMSTSPGQVRALTTLWLDQDVRDLLSSVTQPTLVMHRHDDQLVRVGHGRYLAEHIRPGDRAVRRPRGQHPRRRLPRGVRPAHDRHQRRSCDPSLCRGARVGDPGRSAPGRGRAPGR